MNEQLQGKLVEIITGIQNAVRAGSDFAMEQLPDIAASYILYGRIKSLVMLVLGLGLVFLAYKCAMIIYKINKGVQGYDEPIGQSMSLGAVAVCSGVAGVLMTVGYTESALLVWLAPKVWLLKELAALIR